MNTSDPRPDDRETLSALFDGELESEARMFALRRLGHDTAWQQACGQWQLVGDVLRRQAPIAAPAGLAERVSAAVAREAVAVPAAAAGRTTVASRAQRYRNRWIGGGALAASLALAVAMTSLSTDPAPGEGAVPAVVSADGRRPAGVDAAVNPPSAVASTSQPSGSPDARAPAAEAPTVAALVRRSRVASAAARPVSGAARRSAAARAATADPTATAATALLADPPVDPFNLGRDAALTARPWPRAALPAATGAFTARYGTSGESAGERPTFYPFEPRPQGDAQALAPPSP